MPNLASSSAQPQLTPVPAQRLPHYALLWLALGFTLVLAALVAWALAYLRTQAIESNERLTQSFAQVIEEQTSRTLQTIDQRLQLAASGLAQLEAAGGLNEPSARALLQAQVKELPFARAIWVLDAQGRIQYDSDLGNIGISLADRPYFQVYLAQPQTRFYPGSYRSNNHIEGTLRSFAFRALLSQPVLVVVGPSFERILAPWQRRQQHPLDQEAKQQALKDSEEQLRLVTDHAPEAEGNALHARHGETARDAHPAEKAHA